jgi:hypothetical protein
MEAFAVALSASHVHHFRPAWATSFFTYACMHCEVLFGKYAVPLIGGAPVRLHEASPWHSCHPPCRVMRLVHPRKDDKRGRAKASNNTLDHLPPFVVSTAVRPPPSLPKQQTIYAPRRRDARTHQRWRSRTLDRAIRNTWLVIDLPLLLASVCLSVWWERGVWKHELGLGEERRRRTCKAIRNTW